MSASFSPRRALATSHRERLNAAQPFRFLWRRLFRPDPFRAAMRAFDRRLADARAHHRPTRQIEAERRAFAHAALRGEGTCR